MKKARFVGMEHKVKIPKGKKEKSLFLYKADPDTLAADIYEEDKMTFRYVIDVNTGEHYTYDYKEKKWSTAKLYFAVTGKPTWDGYSCCFCQSDAKRYANVKIDKEAEGSIPAATCYLRDDIIREIASAESEFNRGSRMNAEDRRQKRIRDLMYSLPPLPEDFREWYFRATGLDEINYLIYDAENERYKCTRCGKKIPADRARKIRNLKKTICPACGAEVTPRKNRNQLEVTVDGHATLFQKVDEHTVVARHFDIEAVYDANGRHLCYSESMRMFYSWKWKDGWKEYKDRLYYAQYLRSEDGGVYEKIADFDWKANPCGRATFDSYLYPSDFLSDLAGSALEEKAYMLRAIAETYTCVNVGRLMTCVQHDDSMQTVEYAVRLGFRRITQEAFHARYYGYDIRHDIYDIGGGETINYIRDMPKADRNRLRKMDGGHIAYNWLCYCRENEISVSDEAISFLDEMQIDTDSLEKFPVKVSAEKLKNYIHRQQAESYPGKKLKTVYDQWIDYLSMAQALDKNVTDEMIFWPRELKKRHEQLVEESREKEALLLAKQNLEYAMKREEEIRQKFPNAAGVLEKVRDRFAFEDDTYLIRVPKGLYEISQEGFALHHCVGSSDRYFERMDREETYICFLRKKEAPDAPFYTVEVEPGGTIRQHRGMYDEEPELEKVKPFLRKWQQHLHKNMTDHDRELSELSRAGREKSLAERLLIGGKTDRVYKGLMEDLMEIREAVAL